MNRAEHDRMANAIRALAMDAVRIRFASGERAATVTVEDGPVVVRALRALGNAEC